MSRVLDFDGVEMTVRYRQVPGYSRRHTPRTVYHVDLNGEHIMTLSKGFYSGMPRPTFWNSWPPYIDWTPNAPEWQGPYITWGDTREDAVLHTWDRLQRFAHRWDAEQGPDPDSPEWLDSPEWRILYTVEAYTRLMAALSKGPTA